MPSLAVLAQENRESVTLNKDFEVQKHTIMEQFEPGYVMPVSEREEMKRKRIANAEYALRVLDTVQISDRKRKLLLRDLQYNPFSDRLNKFIVESKFEDDDLNNEQN